MTCLPRSSFRWKVLTPLLALLFALLPLAAAQVVQVAGVDPAVVLQAQRDVAGADLVGKDGPLARLGFDLALLHRSFEAQGNTVAVQAANPNLRVSDGFVVVDFVARGSAQALRADLEALGLQGGSVFGRYVSGRLPISAIPAAAALSSLNHGRASAAAVNVGLVDSQGDEAMRSDVARTTFGVDGTGITIGTLSDSFDCLGGAAGDVASNDLPAGINVLSDETGCGSGSDEGRGMMQLIHDVAPGSSQQFHTAFNGFADFASGIVDLQVAGSDVIVDDVIYFAEAMFQDDIIAQAADQVFAAGVPYFSSAGNNARQSYEDAFRNSGPCPPVIANSECHDFDPGGGVDVLQSISVPNNTSVTFSFQWDEPFFSISGGAGTTNDMDIFLLDGPGTTILAGGATDNLGGNAVEIMSFTNTSGGTVTANVAIVKYTPGGGPDPTVVKYALFGGNSVVFNEFDTDSASSYGHANAAGAASVAAAFFAETPEFGQTPPLLEPFSSGGGVVILFDTAGNPINDLRPKPEFTAPDGTNTTFFGSDSPSDPDTFPNFFGTSAAAPHAAAVAALMLEQNGSLTPTEVYSALAATAIDMGPAGFDNDSGTGLIQADVAIASVLSVELGASAGPNTPGATVTAGPGDEVGVLQVALDVPASSGDLTVDGMTVQAALLSTTAAVGVQAVSLADITDVNVYLDANGNGQIDSGETLLGSADPNSSGVASIDFGSNDVALNGGDSALLLISFEINSSLSVGLVGGALALLVGGGWFIRRRRRLLPLLLLPLVLLLAACPGPVVNPPQARSFSSSLSSISATAASSATVDITGLPLAGSTVTVNP